jgi:hypothetical protein
MDKPWGKYMGFVRDTADPQSRGRLRLFVPDVLGDVDDADHWTDWALPCFPWLVHLGVGSAFVPGVDSGWACWVEFRDGDVRFPVWVGVVPLVAIDTSKINIETPSLIVGNAGTAVQLALKSDVDATNAHAGSHVHTAPGGGGLTSVATTAAPTAVGTSDLRAHG